MGWGFWVGILGVVAIVAGFLMSAVSEWIRSRAELNRAKAAQIRSETPGGDRVP